MNKFKTPVPAIALGVTCMVLSGCSILAPRPDPSQFFVLTPSSQMATGETDGNLEGISLGLGPINFPAYLKRSQMVTRIGPNRVEFSETNRWAEPLETNFAHVLARNLKVLLETDEVAIYPWISSTRLDYEVKIDVLRFERDSEGNAELSARWTVKDGEANQLLTTRHSDLRQPAESSGIDGSVAALSRTAEDLSRDIADALRQLNEKREL